MKSLVLWGEIYIFPDKQLFLEQGYGETISGNETDCYSIYVWEMRKEFEDTNWTYIILN